MGLLITFCLGIFIVIGAITAQRVINDRLIEELSISIAFGTMTALVFLELIPEAWEKLLGDKISLFLLCLAVGMIFLKCLDYFIPEHGSGHDDSEGNVIHIGIVSSIAIVVHNIIEGMAVYSMVKESVRMGLLMALGVGLHNIPMGMIIGSTLRNGKKSKMNKLLAFVSLSTFLGGLLMYFLWYLINDLVIGILISLTLGMIAYIEIFELIPHLVHSKNKKWSFFGAVLGMVIIIASSVFE